MFVLRRVCDGVVPPLSEEQGSPDTSKDDELVKKIADEIDIDFAWESNEVSEAISSEINRASEEIALEIVKQHLDKKN